MAGNAPSSRDSDAHSITKGGGQHETRTQVQARSLTSLHSRNQAEQTEAQLAAEEHARRSDRFMAGGDGGLTLLDSPDDPLTLTYGRRILGRLDEETEEETEELGLSGSVGARSSPTTLSSQRNPSPEDLFRQMTVATVSPSLKSRETSKNSSLENATLKPLLVPQKVEGRIQESEGFCRRKVFDGQVSDADGDSDNNFDAVREGSSLLGGVSRCEHLH